MTRNILLLVTSHNELGDTGQSTGLYLSEFAHAYQCFVKAGYHIQVASPLGGPAPIDPKSLSEEYTSYVKYVQQTQLFQSIHPEAYDAFFVVGGHGVMWDLPHHAEAQKLLVAAFEQGKIVAAVCHGPAALISLRLSHGLPLLRGRRVTGFSDDEEAAIGLTEMLPFTVEDALKQAGAHYTSAPNWQSHVVIDEQLITGQNPASALAVSQAVIHSLSLQSFTVSS
jgi:putative intracellular protease/amidase